MVDTFISRKACNSYILKDENNNGLIVDPGYNEHNALINHIKKLGVNIKAILVTHGHYDHIDALESIIKEFPDALTYINEDEKDVLDNPKLNISQFREDGSRKLCNYLPRNLILLHEGEEFIVAGYNIKMIKTPFHTKGSCCYYLAKENILFSGDTLFFTTIGRTDLPTGSSKTISSSLSKLVKLPNETRVYPGHGVATTLEREKKYNVYLRNI